VFNGTRVPVESLFQIETIEEFGEVFPAVFNKQVLQYCRQIDYVRKVPLEDFVG